MSFCHCMFFCLFVCIFVVFVFVFLSFLFISFKCVFCFVFCCVNVFIIHYPNKNYPTFLDIVTKMLKFKETIHVCNYMLICAARDTLQRKHRTWVDIMCCHYQSAGEIPYKQTCWVPGECMPSGSSNMPQSVLLTINNIANKFFFSSHQLSTCVRPNTNQVVVNCCG